MRKCKMLWVTNSFGCGGAERQISNMFAVVSKYYQIDILYYKEMDNSFKSSINKENLIFINKERRGKILFLLEATKIIRNNKYDIVYAFGGGSANIYGRLSAIFAGTPVIIGAMLGKKHFNSFWYKFLNSFINIFCNYWTVNNTDLVPILQRDLKFIDLNKVKLIHNGFFEADKIDYKLNELTDYDSIKGDKFVIAAVGRLEPVKNYPMLIKAASKIISEYDNVEFWLAGDGTLKDKLQELINLYHIEDKFKLLGFKQDIDVLLSRCDLFVQTSNTEGSPNTLSEAMRAQKPIISTKSTNLEEFIVDFKNGISIEVGSIEELIKSIKYILALNKNELLSMGKASLEIFNKTFNINKAADEMNEFLKKCLEEKGI